MCGRLAVPYQIVLLHTVASLDRSEGGIPRAVAAVVGHMRGRGADAQILAVEASPHSLGTPAGLSVPQCYATSPGSRYACRALTRRLDELAADSRIDLVHDHGLWLPMHHAIAVWCRRRNVPRLVSVRGMLNPWARRHHVGRKLLAWMLFQREGLVTADVLHATSEAEVAAIRGAGLMQPVILLPNGVDLPPLATSSGQRSDRTALFLGRLHPSKGIDLLLEAWQAVAPHGWSLVIAGGGSEAYVRSIKLSISRLGPAASVALHGTVDDVAKWDLYRACDLFVLPSHSENFGSVVAEALATGLPVITTRAAPWDWLPERRAGWWVSVDAASLSQAILEATSLPAEDLGSMGLRGREECRRLFDWSAITSQFLEAYDWLLGRAGMPACVRT